VASALWYLHDSDIIYRDLKADNILVWSLNENELVNVKLSDYGISCFATPQGVSGDEGTPGYQAPEIRTSVGYDEKVRSLNLWVISFIVFQGVFFVCLFFHLFVCFVYRPFSHLSYITGQCDEKY